MRIPLPPPPLQDLLSTLAEQPERFAKVIAARPGPAPEGKYRHWDTLRHVPPPEGLTSTEWWIAIKLARSSLYAEVPLHDKTGKPFRYCVPGVAQQMLMQVDRNASGEIRAAEPVTAPHARDAYLLNSVMEEAITSSQLEGASTTREVAKEMIRRGREPRTRDERMIYNNFQALLFIRRVKDEPLTPSTVFELHRILTDGTLEEADAAGRFRSEDEAIHIVDELGNVLHVPPPAHELPARLQAACDFANDARADHFIHPVVRAIVLHFALAYDHPFMDGNGRTARALFYWAMAREGYWLAEYISISRILRQAPSRYSRSFLYTETDENDLTYFILSQLRIILRAIHDLHEYLERRQNELRATRDLMRRSAGLREQLNSRQLALLRHALKNPGYLYTIEGHRNSHNVSYATARSDLLNLARHGLLETQRGAGRLQLFVSPKDLEKRLSRVA